MLVMTRKIGEEVVIGDDIRIMVTNVSGQSVRLSVSAPREIPVHRGEIHEKIARQAAAAIHDETV